MPPNGSLATPFLNREMLGFQAGAVFQLVVRSRSRTAATVIIRGATRSGTFSYTHTTVSTLVLTTETFNLPDIPIWLTISDENASYTLNTLYVSAHIAVNGDRLYELVAGYIYGRKGITYPAANIENPVPPTVGRIVSLTGVDPAAGVEISQAVPAGVVWHVKAVSFQLVASANAASRRPVLTFTETNGAVVKCFSNTNQIISETKNYSAAAFGGMLSDTIGNDIQINIPNDIYLAEDGTISTVTLNLNASDNFGAPKFWVEEFIV